MSLPPYGLSIHSSSSSSTELTVQLAKYHWERSMGPLSTVESSSPNSKPPRWFPVSQQCYSILRTITPTFLCKGILRAGGVLTQLKRSFSNFFLRNFSAELKTFHFILKGRSSLLTFSEFLVTILKSPHWSLDFHRNRLKLGQVLNPRYHTFTGYLQESLPDISAGRSEIRLPKSQAGKLLHVHFICKDNDLTALGSVIGKLLFKPRPGLGNSLTDESFCFGLVQRQLVGPANTIIAL